MIAVDPLELVDPDRYAQRGYPHDVWTELRAHAPVAWIEPPELEPFWAITKHADITEITKQPLRFSSAQGITLRRAGAPPMPPQDVLVLVDPPKHVPLRRVANPRFSPKAIRARREGIERIALDIVANAVPAGSAASGELDFVEAIAAPFPLAVIASMLGVVKEDWGLLFRWTNEVIGKNDPEYRRPGESAGQTIKRARGELHAYFGQIIEERRRAPRDDDLVSDLIAGEVEGEPLTPEQLVAYCELLVEAGNETTRNAISAGVLALCENPDEWRKLRGGADITDAVEEILRWASPISHFIRVATEDVDIRGTAIGAGDEVALYFASANRDEEVFDEPFAFRIDRHPNPHLAFGFGEHFCMGAQLARIELDVMFQLLRTRFETFEVAGPVERLSSITNGSLKHLPVSYRVAG